MFPLFRVLAAFAVVGCALPSNPVLAPSAAVPPAARTPTAARHSLTFPLRAQSPQPARIRAGHRLAKRDVTRAVARQARLIIDAHGKEPFGTELPFEADGRVFIARIEQHYHPPGGEKRPWGPHPGVSVFVTSESAFAAP